MVQERTGLPLVEEYGLDVNPGSLTRFQITLKVKVVSDYYESESDLKLPWKKGLFQRESGSGLPSQWKWF